MRLLISTPIQLFLFDLASGLLTRLRSGDGEYYGLTWNRDTMFLSHSYVNNEDFLTHKDLVGADRGEVAGYKSHGPVYRTRRRLLLTHQIEWVDDRLLVVDTGRERLSVYGVDGALIRDVALGGLGWDRGPNGQLGHHFNSVHRKGDRVWVVAHGHDQPSEVWELSWPDLDVLRVHVTKAAWAHNVWDGELGLVICDSYSGCLQEVYSGRTIWQADRKGAITRGLAVSATHLFVGHSEPGDRGERRVNDGGLWVIDRATLTTTERFRFAGSGCINEIRILDGSDECHNGARFAEGMLTWLSNGISPEGKTDATPLLDE